MAVAHTRSRPFGCTSYILHFVSAGLTQSRRTLSVIDYRAVCLYSLHCCSSMSFANITGGAQNFMSILIRASQMPSARWKISCGKKGVNYSDTLRTEWRFRAIECTACFCTKATTTILIKCQHFSYLTRTPSWEVFEHICWQHVVTVLANSILHFVTQYLTDSIQWLTSV